MDYRKIASLDSKPSFLGFGCMRFPTKDGKIDEEQSVKLLQAAVDGGVNYFDTAYIYHNSQSEEFIGRFLKTLQRDSFYVATKLPTWMVESLDDAKRIFTEQLQRLQVDYIDFYMLHDLKIDRYEKMEELGVYDYFRQLQKQGKIKHFGHSSHENIENFTKIVNEREWDFVMLHLNYMDTDNLKLYELAVQKNIPVFAMETVKGGSLSNFPDDILAKLTQVNPGASVSSWGVRWAGSLKSPGSLKSSESLFGIKVILSGMSDMAQVEDNLKTCTGFKPLSDAEYAAIEEVKSMLYKRVRNNCTRCDYCMPCPAGVNIPWMFSIWNNYGIYENKGHSNWEWSITAEECRAFNCTGCGKCNELCPQRIDVMGDLKKVTQTMNEIK